MSGHPRQIDEQSILQQADPDDGGGQGGLLEKKRYGRAARTSVLIIAKALNRVYFISLEAPSKEQQREWVQAWDRAGRAMEALRVKELKNMSEAESVRRFNALDIPPPAELSTTSGLVEQQRWFKLLRSKQLRSSAS